MPRQFLLNPDGSLPAGANVAVLEAEGIPLVLPTPVPRVDGMVAVEQEPEQGPDRVWRQVWALQPVPQPEPKPEPEPEPEPGQTEPAQEDGLAAEGPPA